MKKELKQMIRDARARGWTITKTNGGHMKWRHPTGAIMFSAQTPSDHRAISNIRAWIRKIEKSVPVASVLS